MSQQLMLNKILITGGHGNLGSWLVKYFCDKSFDVTITSRDDVKKISNCNYKIINLDLTNKSQLAQLRNLEFDYVIHTASLNESQNNNYTEEALRINALGTEYLLQNLNQASIKKFIYFSTFHIYGASEGMIDESIPPRPLNDYALTHLFAEFYLTKNFNNNSDKLIILRMTNAYGAPTFKDSSKWYLALNDIAKMAHSSQQITLKSNGQAPRDFIWLSDVCEITERVIQSELSGIYNLSACNTFTIFEIAKIVSEAYLEKYGRTISIVKNENDKTIHNQLTVSNKKLIEKIDFQFKNQIKSEAQKIFNLLEN